MDPLPEDLEGVSGVLVVDATDPSLPIEYASPGFERLTGYGADEVVGRNPRLLQGPDTDPRSIEVLRRAVASGTEAYVTLLNYRADGTPFYNEVSLAPEHDAGGRLVRWIGVSRDVTDRVRSDARIASLAYFDALTGLANRAALHDELRSALHRARIHDRELALLLVDLDDFRQVNAVHGEHVGDELLRSVADRLRSLVRPSDLLARPGEDKFMLLVRDVASGAADIGADLAGRIVAALREPMAVGGVTFEPGASAGVSAFPRDAVSAEDLLHHAEAALDVAKRGGKDGFHLYRSRAVGLGLDPDDAFDAASAGAELDRVLREGLVTSVFQPVVGLNGGASRAVAGVEALARGPEGSPLHRADRLLAAAEAAGRVVELDWACRAAAVRGALDAGLGRSVPLFINVRGEALGFPCPASLSELWEQALASLDVVFDLAEDALCARPVEMLRAVWSSPVPVAIDDAGGSARSAALLGLAAPAAVKLDLGRLGEPPATERALLAAACGALRERCGAVVLAERVEHQEDVVVARALGATHAEGWLLGRPGALSVANGDHAALRLARVAPPDARTPFAVVAASGAAADEAGLAIVAALAARLEDQARRLGEGAIVLASFPDASLFDEEAARRFAALARNATLAMAFAPGLPEQPAPGVRGVPISADDPLAAECNLIVLGADTASALTARRTSDEHFATTVTYDTNLATRAARVLLSHTNRSPTRDGPQIH